MSGCTPPPTLLAADLVITRFIDTAEFESALDKQTLQLAKTWAKNYPELLSNDFQEEFGSIIQRLRSGEVTESELAQELRDFSMSRDSELTWNAITLQGANDALDADGLRLLGGKLVSGTLDGMAVLGDLYTLWKPEDGGASGWIDRGAALGNMGAAGLDLAELGGLEFSAAVIPGVGEVVGVGTGLSLGGDWLYHHWTPFHDVADDVGHGVVSVAKDTWHAITSIF
jgi:hypothetical protein